MKPKYYVHTLEGYSKHLQGHFGGYRYHWIAMLKLRWEIMKHPYGEGIITRTAKHPKVSD